ncbi:hypothetical protein, partial [Salmonella enterica]|uniref:hypothetical protein n=1 Tax=Salmonella enterica TaxID=28901 RepID=UPI003299BFFE
VFGLALMAYWGLKAGSLLSNGDTITRPVDFISGRPDKTPCVLSGNTSITYVASRCPEGHHPEYLPML